MFQHERTLITKFGLNYPERAESITGGCSVGTTWTASKEFNDDGMVLCTLKVKASVSGRKEPLIEATALSFFKTGDKSIDSERATELARQECSTIALKNTANIIAEATKNLIGASIDLPIY